MTENTAVIDNETAEAPEVVAEVAETEQVAEVATSNSRYPDEAIGLEISRRMKAAHKDGWTFPRFEQLVAQVKRSEGAGDEPDTYALSSNEGDGYFMGGSALWRTREGRVHVPEVPYITAVLDAIDRGRVTLPEKPTKDAGKLRATVEGLQARLQAVQELAAGSTDVKGVGGLREVLAAILDVADGTAIQVEDGTWVVPASE